jgi:hypothetical protein
MLRSAVIVTFSAFALSGCGLVRTHKTAADFDQALLDKQLLEAAQSIQRAQAELHRVAAVDQLPNTSPPQGSGLPGYHDSRPISIQWNGDASELVRILAMQDNRTMEVRGIKLPLPVSINASRQPYAEVISELLAQLDNRAAVYPLPGRLVLEYLPTKGVIK